MLKDGIADDSFWNREFIEHTNVHAYLSSFRIFEKELDSLVIIPAEKVTTGQGANNSPMLMG